MAKRRRSQVEGPTNIGPQVGNPPQTNYAGTGAPSLAYHGVADLVASFTVLMFFTPSFDSQSSSALAPLLAYTGMPSFQVARPQSTPEKSVPASAAMCSDSTNCALLTPALK